MCESGSCGRHDVTLTRDSEQATRGNMTTTTQQSASSPTSVQPQLAAALVDPDATESAQALVAKLDEWQRRGRVGIDHALNVCNPAVVQTTVQYTKT